MPATMMADFLLQFGLLLVSLTSVAFSACPEHCTCAKVLVGCLRTNYTHLPENIPVYVQDLYLTHNRIHTLGQGALSKYENLTQLVLSNGKIEVVEPNAFSGLSKLISLNLRNNRIKHLQSYMFSGLIKLKTLILDYNRIGIVENFAFQGLNLVKLGLEQNTQLRYISDKAFYGAQVEKLMITNSSLSSRVADALLPLKESLRELVLQDNQGKLHFSVESFSGYRFRSLNLNNNGINNIDFLENVVTDSLALNSNPTGPIDFNRYPNLRQVRQLHLSNTSFSIVLPTYFSGMTHLSYLGLNSNGITSLSEGMRPVFMRLQYLFLQDNKLHCNCEMRWLKRWRDSLPLNNKLGGKIMCTTPSSIEVDEMRDAQFTCSKPGISLIPGNLTITEADDASLSCSGAGDPAPTIVWSSPNGDVVSIPPPNSRSDTMNQGILHIRAASFENSGWYVCAAVNLAGNDSSRMFVDVEELGILNMSTGMASSFLPSTGLLVVTLVAVMLESAR